MSVSFYKSEEETSACVSFVREENEKCANASATRTTTRRPRPAKRLFPRASMHSTSPCKRSNLSSHVRVCTISPQKRRHLFRSPKMYSPFSKNTRKKTSFAQKRARGKKTRRNATKRKETRRGDSKITRARNERCSQNVARTDDDDDDDDGGLFFSYLFCPTFFLCGGVGFLFFYLSRLL